MFHVAPIQTVVSTVKISESEMSSIYLLPVLDASAKCAILLKDIISTYE